jgi:hypothetical protein
MSAKGTARIGGLNSLEAARRDLPRSVIVGEGLRRSAVTFHPDRSSLNFGTVSLANNLFGPVPRVLGTIFAPLMLSNASA